MRIAVGPDGNAWVVNNAGSIFRFDGFMFQKLPGSAHDIGVARRLDLGCRDRAGAGWLRHLAGGPGPTGFKCQAVPPISLSALKGCLGS